VEEGMERSRDEVEYEILSRERDIQRIAEEGRIKGQFHQRRLS